ncbi:hypothetical protein CDQ84_15820 [Clostridium thermosuccinogenes]|uniref:Uncharacterized protein n=1 Tax=Clostridium thermosuccinogenes TaxID=84032 RepID=A0A2K2FBL3_9CLOT|nr:hypothetical protein [Pseudoclostridium thermosuccinogenes]AUS97402.1 hypothetical protein CDO33_13705 [Pseudoclostridium thermosuccinogenes]PNT95236.1 hypothetical protein CDQ85_15680 [Pseudoclostridium thermosuccinogenes]PNT96148.1 hypothetical protein CDQ84_15820 [Pseudoclostridium thermosuccinogenes]
MHKHYYRKQNNVALSQDEAILIGFVKIKHVNRLKKRKARNTANYYFTLGRGRNFKNIFESIIS